jgi:hypothetical protein
MTLWTGACHIILCCWWQLLYRHLLQWQSCLLTLCCTIITITITMMMMVITFIIIIVIIILRNSFRSISVYSRFMEIPLLWFYVSVVISGVLFNIFFLMYSAPQIFCVLKTLPLFTSHEVIIAADQIFKVLSSSFGILCFLILI